MAIAGRVAIVPKDVYDASLPYKRLDAVMHNNTLYIAKKNVPAGKTPGADTKDYWMSGPSAGASAPATTTSNGLMSATDKKAIEVLKKPLATCATGRAAAAKVATLANFVLQVGTSIAVKFTDTAGTANPTTGNLTLNVNGTGAKTIGYFRNGHKAAISYASGNFFYNNATHIFTYDGTFWLCMDWNADRNTTYSNFVKSGAGAKAGLVPAPSTTAGTSKYLREDGTWQTPPDTKTSVVNNQTTTVAGYALDARQANPNVKGSLGAQIKAINDMLNTKKIPSFAIENIFTGNPFCVVSGTADLASFSGTKWEPDNGGYHVEDIKYPAGGQVNVTVNFTLTAHSIVIIDVNTLNSEKIEVQGSCISYNFTDSPENDNISIRFAGRNENTTTSTIRYMPLVIHLA